MRKKSWSLLELRRVAKKSFSVRQVLIGLGLKPAGGNYTHVKRELGQYKISTKHFRGKGWNKGLHGIGKPRQSLEQILVKKSTFQSFKLKKRLFAAKLKSERCEICGWSKKSVDGRVPLELDHINGNRFDNRLVNLRILCPNCHSLQPTHRALNIKRRT